MKPTKLGTQYLVELYDCSHEVINNKDIIKQIMIKAAQLANATIVAEVFHVFNPHGISGVVVIAESHMAIHTWPEYDCASIDIFSCSPLMDSKAAIEYLKIAFKATNFEVLEIDRGKVNSLDRVSNG